MAGPRRQVIRPKYEKGEVSQILKRMFKEIFSKHLFALILTLICIVVLALSSVYGTLFLKSLINDYIIPLTGQSNPDFSQLNGAVIKIALVYLMGVIASFIQALIMRYVTNDTLYNIRTKMFDHMEQLPIKYFDSRTHGDIMSQYTNDVDTLRQMINQALPSLVSSVITIASVVISMFILNAWLTLLVFVIYFGVVFLVKNIGSKASKYFVAQQKALGGLNGYIEEMIDGQKVVKVFCHEKESMAGFDQKNEELSEIAVNANRNSGVIMPLMGNLGHLAYAIIAIVGSIMAVKGLSGLDLGTIAAFLQFTRNFSMPISQVSQQFTFIIASLAGAKRIFALLDEPIEVDNGDVTLVNAKYLDGQLVESDLVTKTWAWKVPSENDSFKYVEVKGDVRFYNVDFGYNKDSKVIHDISLFAKPGQKIAFVGHTGAGKTTITNLINRFYDIDQGSITFDGIDIKQIKKSDLRHSLGMVLQDTNLFTGTIKENIRFGRLNATDEEVVAAAKLANADSFINQLPGGYDTLLTNNGANLSQGQRQLLSIARAAIANDPVLILDEATSSIDTRTEKIIQEGMDKLMENRTVFVIAHRLSTVRNAKAIIVMDDGKIIERGPHEDLIKEKGKYYELYTGASELE